jgi:tetratricopeptide (TPR) repeat protein
LPARRSLLEFALYCGDEREARLRMDQLKALSADDPLVRLAAQTLGLATEGIDAPSPASVPDFKTPAELECLAEMLAPHVAAHPSDVDAAALLAMTYTRLNRKADREKILRAAERSEAGGGQVRLIRAECALREGDFAGARRWAESLLAHPEYQVSARRILAAGWQREAAADRSAARVHQRAALEQYRRILALEPTDAQAANNTAWILGEVLGQRCDAIELASQAVKRLPNPPAQLLDTYGWLLFRQNRPQDALGWLERAHVLQPDDATVRLHLAACYGRVGQTAKSQALWREALVARHVDEPKPIVSHAHVLLAGTTKDNPRMHR